MMKAFATRWSLCVLLFLVCSYAKAADTKVELLWPAGAPLAKGDTDNDKPTVSAYPAPDKKRTGAAVIVCPGGGYGALPMDHEGKQVAEWLNSLGVTAFVLKYRHR